MYSRILCILLTLLAVLPAFSQKRCRIFGLVRDDAGLPIELAAVRVLGTLNATTTNLQGQYSIYVQADDSLTLQYSMIGYETRKRTINRPQADSLRLDVTLPVYGNVLGTAEVKGQGVQSGSTQKLAIPDSRTTPSTTGNAVEELVATQAGVSTHSELSSQYNVRGGSFDENCVYLNGFEIYRPMLVRSGQQEGLSIINSDMVESIGFSSGGFEARYGDKMSSVLDITYKRPQGFELSAYASLLGAGLYVGAGSQKLSFMSSVRYKSPNYMLSSLDTEGEYSPTFLDYQAVFSYRPSRRWSFDVLANYSDNRYNFTPVTRSTSFGTLDEPRIFTVFFDGWEKDYYRTFFGAASITHNFNPNTYLALNFSTYATKEREAYDIQGEYWLDVATAQNEMGVGTYMEHARNQLRARVFNVGLKFRTKFTAHTLLAGLNFSTQHINERAREYEMRDSMDYSLPHRPDRLDLIYTLDAHTEMDSRKWELFAQDSWRMKADVGLFNLTYGLRFTYSQFNSEALLSPRVSLGFLPAANDRWIARLACGFYYQTPFYKELRDTTLTNGVAVVSLNRDIRSQRSIHFVLGADYTFRAFDRPFKFTAEAYYKNLHNLIPYSVDNVRTIYYGRNMANGYTAGIDFKIFGEFVEGYDSWLTFSLMSTKEKFNGQWIPRPTDQRYAVNLHFTDHFAQTGFWSRLTATLKAAIAAGLPFGPPHTDRSKHRFRAPAYKRVDLGLSFYAIKPGMTHRNGRHYRVKNLIVGLDCLNLFGIDNVNSYYWVTDITGTQSAIPNYLTGRQLNVRLSIKL